MDIATGLYLLKVIMIQQQIIALDAEISAKRVLVLQVKLGIDLSRHESHQHSRYLSAEMAATQQREVDEELNALTSRRQYLQQSLGELIEELRLMVGEDAFDRAEADVRARVAG